MLQKIYIFNILEMNYENNITTMYSQTGNKILGIFLRKKVPCTSM